jgi:hypothetical protein
MALWNLFKKKRIERLNPESRWGLALRDGAVGFCRKFFNWQSLARKTELAYPANE